jgi:predicted transcriptional regulator
VFCKSIVVILYLVSFYQEKRKYQNRKVKQNTSDYDDGWYAYYYELEVNKIMKNRSDIEIMACILRSAIGKWEYKTTIMNNAAVSHSQLVRYLAIAVERGLVEYSEVRDLYRITNAGLVFLEKYAHLLSLLPKIPEQSGLVATRVQKMENHTFYFK